MEIVFRDVTVIDQSSPFHLKQVDLLIENGIIRSVGDKITTNAKQVNIPGLHVSLGWIDMQCTIGEPGFENRETLKSAAQAAIQGGISTVAMLPSTQPATDQRIHAEAIIAKSKNLPITIVPIGALTMNRKGEEMTEMIDLYEGGVPAFSDGKRTIQNSKLMELIMIYAKNRNALIIHHADTPSLSANGMINEGLNSVHLGLKGIPTLAEKMAVQRDLEILHYTGGRLHFPLLTSKDAIDLIREKKKSISNLTCGIASHYLLFKDDSLQHFDPLYKVMPPYRTQEDITELINALNDGTIDVICSDHTPVEDELKNNELEHALPGIINLETMFSAARTATINHVELPVLIEKITVNPRKLLGLKIPTIRENESADLTFFLPNYKWVLSKNDIKSKSNNTPYIGFEFTGKVVGVYTKSAYYSID